MGGKNKSRVVQRHKPSSLTHRVPRNHRHLRVVNRDVRGRRLLIEEKREAQPLPELPQGSAWFVIAVSPQLRRDPNDWQGRPRLVVSLEKHGLPTFQPRYTRRVAVKLQGGRLETKRTTRLPLLPGYVFVALPALWISTAHGARPYDASASGRAVVSGMDDVLGILTNEHRAIAVPEALLSILAETTQDGRFDSEGRAMARASDFAAGEALAIVRGAFAGLPAAFERAASEDRLRVLLEFFGGQRVVEVGIEDVQRRGRAA